MPWYSALVMAAAHTIEDVIMNMLQLMFERRTHTHGLTKCDPHDGDADEDAELIIINPRVKTIT
jgi:hypothetical protein